MKDGAFRRRDDRAAILARVHLAFNAEMVLRRAVARPAMDTIRPAKFT